MDLDFVIRTQFFFLHGRLVSIPRNAKMVINIILHVPKSRADMAFFMHLFWERYALVNVLLWPMTAIACFIFLMAAEFQYTLFSRLFYFVVGGGA